MTQRSDEQLMLDFANADAKAFEILYARHKDPVYRYYLRHVSNPATCQELFQDLWMKIIKSKDNYQIKASFKTWLYTLAHHRLVDWYRRNNLKTNAFADNEQSEQAFIEWNPENELQTKRLSKHLKKAIGKLPFEQREVFLLHQEAALSFPQIAEMMQLGLEKIKSRYRYALQKLRISLESVR